MCACWLACVLPMWCVTITRVNKTRRFSRRSKAAVFPVWRLIHRYSRERQELLWGTGNELLYFASTKQLSGCSLAWTAHDYFLFYILAKTKLLRFSQGATWCKLLKMQKKDNSSGSLGRDTLAWKCTVFKNTKAWVWRMCAYKYKALYGRRDVFASVVQLHHLPIGLRVLFCFFL